MEYVQGVAAIPPASDEALFRIAIGRYYYATYKCLCDCSSFISSRPSIGKSAHLELREHLSRKIFGNMNHSTLRSIKSLHELRKECDYENTRTIVLGDLDNALNLMNDIRDCKQLKAHYGRWW